MKLTWEEENDIDAWYRSNQISIQPVRGVASYFCHNANVAEVVDLKLNGTNPVIECG